MTYGYIRVSSDKQTVENQRFEIKNFCKRQNMKVDGWIEETISGTKNYSKRRLGVLLKKVTKGDMIICSELSRLGRSLFMIMDILNICMNKECQVWTIKDNYRLGDDISSKVLAFAFGLSAEIERNLISQRTREALARNKAEGVVLLGAYHAVKGVALQFGRGVVRYTHGAQELLSAMAELEAVGIHQGDGGVVCHQHAGGVDVTDDAAGVVDGGNSARNVGGGARQKAIVDVRKMLLARTGGVQVVQGATVAHGFHQQAGKSAILGANHVHGKGRKGRLPGQAGIHHGSNLGGQLGLVRCLVEFHRMVAPVGGSVHAAFTAPAQPFTQLQSTPTAQTQFQAVGRVFLVIGTGGHGRWGVSGMGGVLRRARPSGKVSGPGGYQSGGFVMASVLFGGLCFELVGWFWV